MLKATFFRFSGVVVRPAAAMSPRPSLRASMKLIEGKRDADHLDLAVPALDVPVQEFFIMLKHLILESPGYALVDEKTGAAVADEGADDPFFPEFPEISGEGLLDPVEYLLLEQDFFISIPGVVWHSNFHSRQAHENEHEHQRGKPPVEK